MPEHRPGTPQVYATLESFLWWDFRDAEDWSEWAQRKYLASSSSAALPAFGRAVALQRVLRRLEAANNGLESDVDAVAQLNLLIERLKVRPQVSPSGDIAFAANPRAADGSVALLLLMALDSMAQGVWGRFKLCREPTCSASFYDSSKSATKVWCSMALCGSRDKMRRLRERRKS